MNTTPLHKISSFLLVALNLVSASWGLAYPEVYQEPLTYVKGWSKATLRGVDLVSLVAFAGMAILLLAGRKGPRRSALWLGALFFSAYAHSFQVFTTGLNAKYPLHLAGFVLGIWGSLRAYQERPPSIRISSLGGIRAKAVSVWMIVLALILLGVWTTEWYGQVASGFRDALQADAVRSIAALDLTMAFPAFLWVGFGLWRGDMQDSPIPTALNLAFGVYMAALAAASWTNLAAGMPGAMAEFPQWAFLAVASATAAVTMLPRTGRSRQASAMC